MANKSHGISAQTGALTDTDTSVFGDKEAFSDTGIDIGTTPPRR